jgi:hypothetical protein
MGKYFFKIGALALLVVLGYPVIHYRAVTPCGMYRAELTRRMERSMEEAKEIARSHAEQAGVEGSETADRVAAAIDDAAAGIATGLVEAKVRRMSAGKCATELWRVAVRGQDP